MPEVDYKQICQNTKIWWQNMHFITAMQNGQETTPYLPSGGSFHRLISQGGNTSF